MDDGMAIDNLNMIDVKTLLLPAHDICQINAYLHMTDVIIQCTCSARG